MLHYEKRSWFNPHPGYGHIERKAEPPKRIHRTVFAPDDVDFAVWERNFNKQFGLQ